MPHFSNTPEALLGRNDSKNPSSTCKGITSSGRPCRRALARRTSDTSGLNGVVALVKEDGEIQEVDFYCWQHKDQAEQRADNDAHKSKGRRFKRRSTELYPLKERSSIDTLMQRLDIESERKKTKNPRPPPNTTINDFATSGQPPPTSAYEKKAKPKGFWASLCCVTTDDDDYVEIVRHKKRVDGGQGQSRPGEAAGPRPSTSRPPSTSTPARTSGLNVPLRPTSQQRYSSSSQTNGLLSLIPQHLSPQTTSTLLAELVKPISPADEEGYIYIFWLTPQSNNQPAESTARSLLVPPASRPRHERRVSDVMTEFSYDGSEESDRGFQSSSQAKKTIMLKIGRANNITRRMHEWQRQCGYALNLVRWYPYVPSSAAPSPAPSPQHQSLYPDLSKPPALRRQSDVVRKVPCVKRVERLIHLEMAEQQVKKQCAACGKEHREWVEVQASRAGIKAVDDTVKRWVEWAERQAS